VFSASALIGSQSLNGARAARLKDGFLFAFAAGVALLPLSAGAQTAPPPQVNPGLISNQEQQNRRQLEQQNALPQGPAVLAPPAYQSPVGAPGGPTFVLRAVKVDASHFLSKPEIGAITAKYVGKRVDISGVQKMVKEINDLYAARGIVTAAAYLPPQKLKNGVVVVKIVEGRLGKIKISGANQLSPDFVLSHVDQKAGDIVDVPKMTRQLAFFNKTGIARIQALMQPGAQFGLTDVELSVVEPPKNLIQVFGDNMGVSSVGSYEVGTLLQHYGLIGFDDRLTVYAVKSQGDTNGNVAYNTAIDPWGGRLGLSVTSGAIHIVQGPYTSLNVHGGSQTAAVNVSQPILGDAEWMLLVNGSLTHEVSTSDQTDIRVTGDHTTLETGGVTLAYTGATVSGSVSPTVSAAQSHSDVTGTNENFVLQSGTFSSLVKLPYDFTASLGGAWQAASEELLPGDQLFQIGGPTTVRGYPTEAVAGPEGYYANLELHHPVTGPMNTPIDAYVFYDRGSVYNHFPAVQTLDAVGAGLSWTVGKYAVAEVSAGFPLDKVVEPQAPCEVYFRLTAKIE
jgi:hemolysin activation/secretion protein